MKKIAKKSKKKNETESQAYNDSLVEKKADITIQNYMDECESESYDNDQQFSNGKKESVTPRVKVTTSLNLCLNEITDTKKAILKILEKTNGIDIDYDKEQENFLVNCTLE